MLLNESELKKHLKSEPLSRVYFLYGEEPYLSAHYAKQIIKSAVGDDSLAEFNIQRFDGGCRIGDIEDAAEMLPLMAERKCVEVRDLDVGKASAADQEQLLSMLKNPPESCVIVFWTDNTTADMKNAKWKAFAKAVDAVGIQVKFEHKTTADIVRMLCAGAAKRGCSLDQSDARVIIERCGNELTPLLGELEKLCAAAAERGSIVSREIIDGLCTENLEASVFDLSRAILQGSYVKAYDILHRLFSAKEEPVAILAVLSNAYADLYRAKVAKLAGERAESMADSFAYRGREFRLRNAARDCERLSIDALRRCVDVLEEADTALKSSPMDKHTVLEKTAARLILLARDPDLF